MNIIVGSTVTMTSLELVDFINAREGRGNLTHANFMAKVPKVLRLEDIIRFQDTYRDAYKRDQPMYRFPKREASLMAMSYSYELQAEVFDRMTALEAALEAAPLDPLKVLNDPAAMRGLLLNYVDKVIALESVVAVQTPQVQAFKLIAQAEGSLCFTDAAKTLQIRPKDLTLWLSANKWIYKRLGSSWIGYQERIQSNLIEHKIENITRPDGTTKVVTQARITPKGISALASVFKEAA